MSSDDTYLIKKVQEKWMIRNVGGEDGWDVAKDITGYDTLEEAILYCQGHYSEYGYCILGLGEYDIENCDCRRCKSERKFYSQMDGDEAHELNESEGSDE